MGEPSGLGSGGKSSGNDATGLTDGKETAPVVRGNDAATIGSKEAGLEIEGPEEMTLGTLLTRRQTWKGRGCDSAK
jgi:hypothetical protein